MASKEGTEEESKVGIQVDVNDRDDAEHHVKMQIRDEMCQAAATNRENDADDSSSAEGEQLDYDVVGKGKPVTLEWNDIVLKAPEKQEKRTFPWQKAPETKYKTILEHVSGKARPGEIIAIMGSR